MPEAEPPRVTALLVRWRGGDDAAGHELLPLVHAEMQRIARHHMAGERRGHVLQTTALVNEAYIRLVDARRVQWRDRAHFFGLAAVTMRRVLVDHARRRNAAKRDADALDPIQIETGGHLARAGVEILDLDRALTAFASEFPRAAKVVELRYFAGLDLPEVAAALDLSLRTAERDWRFARAWLRDRLESAP